MSQSAGGYSNLDLIARNLRAIRPKAYTRWYLDALSGKQMYMWRAVDGEGEVLEIQPQRDKDAANAIVTQTPSLPGLRSDGYRQ
jgi:transposase-like protein